VNFSLKLQELLWIITIDSIIWYGSSPYAPSSGTHPGFLFVDREGKRKRTMLSKYNKGVYEGLKAFDLVYYG
jgi:hypothetical protein